MLNVKGVSEEETHTISGIVAQRVIDCAVCRMAGICGVSVSMTSPAVMIMQTAGTMQHYYAKILDKAKTPQSKYGASSKYAFFRKPATSAQMISYKVSIGLTLFTVHICIGCSNLTEIGLAQKKVCACIPWCPVLLLFYYLLLSQ